MCPIINMYKLLSKHIQNPNTFQDLPFRLWYKSLSCALLDYSIKLLTGLSSVLTHLPFILHAAAKMIFWRGKWFCYSFVRMFWLPISLRVKVLTMACNVTYLRFLVGMFLISQWLERYWSLVGTTRVSNIPWNIHISNYVTFVLSMYSEFSRMHLSCKLREGHTLFGA